MSQPFSHLKLAGLSGNQQFEAWKLFMFQFNNYVLAMKHDQADDQRKVALLLHLLGPEVIPIFQSFNIKVESSKLPDIVKLFENFFSPKKNTSLERQKFLSRKQKPGESLDSFITDLKNLASVCELGDLSESLIKDLFILGLQDEYLYIKEQLLQKGDEVKKLEDLMNIAKTMEMSRNQGKSLEMETHDVMKVHKHYAQSRGYHSQNLSQGQSTNYSNQPKYNQSNYSKNNQQSISRCGNCGQYHRFKCPALHAKCNLCQRKGHYAKMCRSQRQVKMISEQVQDDESENVYFIGSVKSQAVDEAEVSKWKVLGVITIKLVKCALILEQRQM